MTKAKRNLPASGDANSSSESEAATIATAAPEPMAPPTEPPIMVNVWPAACPRCGSTDRVNYSKIRTRAKAGKLVDREYTHISIKSTRCKKCGRPRSERHFLNVHAGDRLPADL